MATTVTSNEGGYPLRNIIFATRNPDQIFIGMSMDINKTGSNYQTGGVDYLSGLFSWNFIFYGNNFFIFDADISSKPGVTAAVNNLAVHNGQIILLGTALAAREYTGQKTDQASN